MHVKVSDIKKNYFRIDLDTEHDTECVSFTVEGECLLVEALVPYDGGWGIAGDEVRLNEDEVSKLIENLQELQKLMKKNKES